MKLFKVWFGLLKKSYPEVSHDEIDCGLTWVGALETIQIWIRDNSSCGELERLSRLIEEELKGSNRKSRKF